MYSFLDLLFGGYDQYYGQTYHYGQHCGQSVREMAANQQQLRYMSQLNSLGGGLGVSKIVNDNDEKGITLCSKYLWTKV